ncbi:MAG: DNA polymerase III subunit alpha [Proteobacteria bacterium]|nr:DNA polymerase III subunit alpha [Pseudomonadota bacterium]
MSEENKTFPFVHLHVHSEYSLIDGTIRTSKAISKVKEMGHQALALTDSGNLFGAIEFYTNCKNQGIKAIIGSEIYFEGFPETLKIASLFKDERPQVGAFHLPILCKNNDGYKHLCKIVSAAYTEGLRDVPICSLEILNQHLKDVIVLSGDLRSELSYLVTKLRERQSDELTTKDDLLLSKLNPDGITILNAIESYILSMQGLVGRDAFYIELIDNNLEGQRRHLKDLVQVARHFSVPIVCSADAHYLDESFATSYAVFVAIKAGVTFKDLRGRNKKARFHLLTNEEVKAIYGEWPEAIENTVKIAEQCHVSFKFGDYYLPKFSVPEGRTEGEFLADISKTMLEDRLTLLSKVYGPSFDEDRKAVYRARLDYEISVIQKMGFPGYFLIVQDFINWAKSQDIPVGPGRGSGAGSLVAYSLRITDLDPLRFNLLFERFLNPERISMPDFDVDFCQDRRGEVIDYVTKKYGAQNVAQIATFGKMKTKLAIRDVGRVMELSYGNVDRIAKLIPSKVQNEKGEDIEPNIALAMKAEPRLQEEADKNPTIADILKITADLEGLNRQTGMHAAGVVMSDGPMTDYVPVFTTEDGGLITQFEMKNAEKVGLVKFDFLGLKTLTVLQNAIKLIQKERAPQLDIETINLEDKTVYKNISTGFTIGIFQLEGDGMMQLVKKLQPSCFEDIIALVALFRPGPLGSGMVDDFVERKHGRQQIRYPLPQLEDILRETYGVILYQEQVQKTAVALANYTPGEADLLRRAMGKKDKDVMAKQKVRFLDGAAQNQLDLEKAGEIFDLMAKFAEYGFNKSHSAAYGLVSYQTAYLKTHFRDLYMAAIMTCDADDTDKVIRYAEDCKRMRISLLPPHINESLLEFSVPESDVIRWGLAAIKGIGASSVRPIIEARQVSGPFKDFVDLAQRVNLHQAVGKKTLELLIKIGAFDSFGMTRNHMLSIISDIVKFSESLHADKKRGQKSLFDFATDSEDKSPAITGAFPQWIGIENLKVPVTLDGLNDEKKLIGIYMTGHPIDFYPHDVKRFARCNLSEAFNFAGKGDFTMVAIIQETTERLTKTNTRLAYIKLEDRSGSIEAIMGAEDIPLAFPVPGTPVLVNARVRKLPDGTVSTRVKLMRVTPLEQVRQQAIKSLTITIDARTASARQGASALLSPKERIQQIRESIGDLKGNTELIFEMIYDQSSARIKAPNGIELTDKLLRKLRELSCSGRYG